MLKPEISHDEVQDDLFVCSRASPDRSGDGPEFTAALIFGQVELRFAEDGDEATDSEVCDAVSSQGSGCDAEGCGKHFKRDRTTHAPGAAEQQSWKF